ncbi:MAG TPA: aminotransferase class V-fold PLP-dependent enzyme [Sphingobacteriaceae bacterium]|nr:aminotransferase class V-fold PLP-dependent enzyme [Sphingobacteriaceae bacterium]
MKRRDLLKGLTLLPLAGGVLSSKDSLGSVLSPLPSPKRDLFKELGVRTFINGRGTITFMTGSLMHDEVLDTIRNTSKSFCMIDELQDKVGAKIAEWTHAEAATVTSGAFSALMLGMAGVLSGLDAKKAAMIPNLEGTGMKTEVIMQKGHEIGYNHAFSNCGVKVIMIDGVEELERTISDKTALMHFLNATANSGKINHEEWVRIARKHNIPTMIDMAADVPPVENLWKFNDMGFDLVCCSGGKAIRGPQSSGILMGKKDLIAAARLSAAPRANTIGRGHKVNKEEILGLYVAIERFIKTADRDWKMWENQIAHIENTVKTIKGVSTRAFVPPFANHVPTLEVKWDPEVIKLTTQQMQLNLRNGNPSIEINPGNNSIQIATFVMIPGEEKILAKRLKEELSKT